MKKILALCLVVLVLFPSALAQEPVFDKDFPDLDSQSVSQWWDWRPPNRKNTAIVEMNVPRDQVVAFAVYTHDHGVLKLSAQLFPLKPDEARTVRLEFNEQGTWNEVATAAVQYPGWDAHFRVQPWDNTRSVRYRVRHGTDAMFDGTIRRDPTEKPTIVVGVLSCNSSRTKGPREEMIANLKAQDPDFLFFAGDQSYHHTEHTAGWLEFGLQFREIMRDRPTVTIPDDHDVGQGNIWGQNGRKAATPAGPDGGYHYPASYVNMVQRQQTWHLPDPLDPAPIERGITVYFTRLRVGGIDFAIIEDRKFKSGPEGKIPQMGPRPDHINDPNYDRKSVDLPRLELLGARQLKFLEQWTQDWTGADLKCVLSQTALCGAVHLHGNRSMRLLADLDSNAWPQSGRNAALRVIRRAWAPHLCGDQHLAVVVKHGIDQYDDGPFGFTAPAIVNTIYGRWWHPVDEKAGLDPVPGSPLPWTGKYEDGLGNKISMMAYANPGNVADEGQRGDGYGLVRFDKRSRKATFECWPRFAKVSDGDKAQYPGWPVTISLESNDGRKRTGYLPELIFPHNQRPVVEVVHEGSNEVLYCIRVSTNRFRPPVYTAGSHTVRIGRDRPTEKVLTNLNPTNDSSQSIQVNLD